MFLLQTKCVWLPLKSRKCTIFFYFFNFFLHSSSRVISLCSNCFAYSASLPAHIDVNALPHKQIGVNRANIFSIPLFLTLSHTHTVSTVFRCCLFLKPTHITCNYTHTHVSTHTHTQAEVHKVSFFFLSLASTSQCAVSAEIGSISQIPLYLSHILM